MPIPASGFCLSTVKNEFTTPRYGQETFSCFLNFASQNTIIGSCQNNCKLTQFANKKRTAVGSTIMASGHQEFGGSPNGYFCVQTCITDTGNDLRPTNCNQASFRVWYCITANWGFGNIPVLVDEDIADAVNTSTPTTLSTIICTTNQFIGCGSAVSNIWARGISFNGFGDVCTGEATAQIIWLDFG